MRFWITRYLALLLALVLVTSAFAGATVKIYPNGSKTVTVPVDQYINVYSGGATTYVYKQVGYPNVPAAWVLETGGEVANEEVSFGPYTVPTEIKIEAGVDGASYSVGALAAAIPCAILAPSVDAKCNLAVVAKTTTATLLVNDLMKGIITATHSEGHTIPYTLPTGTLTDAGTGLAINSGFHWSLINLSAAAADTITLTAGSGHTIVGVPIIQSAHSSTGELYGASARFFTKKTAANTFVTYRID